VDDRARLSALLAEAELLRTRFERGSAGAISRRDMPRLTRIVAEAKHLAQEELGLENDFAKLLSHTLVKLRAADGTHPDHLDECVEFVTGALRQLERKRSLKPDAVVVPASNRYVSLRDNQRDEPLLNLAVLKEEVRGANDVDEEDRLIALSEIAAFEATIVQPRVSTDLIQRFVDSVLTWIQRTFTAAAVQEVAQRLIQALLKLIT
jgi:hypothetical protein